MLPNPSSTSILPSKPSKPTLQNQSILLSPYLVGFDHGREDNEMAFTTGPSRDRRQMPYQYPVYRKNFPEIRFQLEFDYYSVGLVLLEIRLWTSLERLVSSSAADWSAEGRDKSSAEGGDKRNRSIEQVVYTNYTSCCRIYPRTI